MDNQAKKHEEDEVFSANENSYRDVPVFKTAILTGISKISSLLPSSRLRMVTKTANGSVFADSPTRLDRIANHTLKYSLIFLNGYFIGIIIAILFLI